MTMQFSAAQHANLHGCDCHAQQCPTLSCATIEYQRGAKHSKPSNADHMQRCIGTMPMDEHAVGEAGVCLIRDLSRCSVTCVKA